MSAFKNTGIYLRFTVRVYMCEYSHEYVGEFGSCGTPQLGLATDTTGLPLALASLLPFSC